MALTVVACSSSALVSQGSWGERPHPRFAAPALAFDVARLRLVALEGYAHAANPPWFDVAEWNGQGWAVRSLLPRPGLGYAAMAFDDVTQRLILVGGATQDETWSWDGLDWQRLAPATSPPPGRFVLLRDPTRARVLWVGVADAGPGALEVWTWNGVAWSPLGGAPHFPYPGATFGAGFDSGRGRIVLVENVPGRNASTWEWNGTWTLVGPAPRLAPGAVLMAYDLARQATVLVDSSSGQTWSWTGAAWIQHQPATQPAFPRALAYDPAHARVMAIAPPGELWSFDGARWDLVAEAPIEREEHALCSDGRNGNVVMFGGSRVTGLLGDTWTWDGRRWARRAPPPPLPAPRSGHTIAELGMGPVILFGGQGSNGLLNDTWAWNGAAWQPQFPSNAPAPRHGHAACPGASGRLLLFGGFDASGAPLDDTWEFAGGTWTRLAPAVRPPARGRAALARDPNTGGTLMFGGQAGHAYLADTWEWTGGNWRLLAVPGPGPRSGAGLVYDEQRAAFVLHGGSDGVAARNDTWEWNGTAWALLAPAGIPMARARVALAFDPRWGQTVMFGGIVDAHPTTILGPIETRTLDTARAAGAVRYGAGCGGATGVPLVHAVGRPFVGNDGFGLDVLQARPNAPLALIVSAGAANLGFGGGCTLLVDLATAVWFPLAGNVAGFGALPVPVPLTRSLASADLFAQALVLDPSGPALGVSASAGVRLELGN